MGKTPWRKRGKDKYLGLVPAVKVALGDKVWWQHTFHHEGCAHQFWRFGIVQVKRGKVVLVRDGYSCEHVVGVDMLFKPET